MFKLCYFISLKSEIITDVNIVSFYSNGSMLKINFDVKSLYYIFIYIVTGRGCKRKRKKKTPKQNSVIIIEIYLIMIRYI